MQPVIAGLTDHAAKLFGDRMAITMEDGVRFSFSEIDRLAGQVAAGLIGAGIDPGDRVILHLPNCWEWIAAYHGIVRAGAVVVPVNIMLTLEELNYILSDSGASAVVMPTQRCASVLATSPAVVVIGVGGEGGSIRFEELLDKGVASPSLRSGEELAAIAYTSGTSGRPKGVMLSNRNIFTSLAWTAVIHDRGPDDVILSALPFSHVYGNAVMNSIFLAGSRLVAPARFDAGETLRIIAAEQVTLLEGVPTMFYQILRHPALDGADLSSLTRCTVGGQTMAKEVMEEVAQRLGCRLLELWGMTELAGPAVSHHPCWPEVHGSIGRPFPGVEIKIADPCGADHDVPSDSPGELMIRGPLVMKGYWGNPAATSAAIDEDGWLATGDIARQDEKGHFYIIDRKNDMIITAGYNVYPGELERVIGSHPQVAMVAVGSLLDPEKGELAKAYVVLRGGSSLDEAALIDHCRRYLAPYKVPRSVAFVPDLPTTSTGKIMRRALRDLEPTLVASTPPARLPAGIA
ncbi:class I adenylate-forming enzyme family protein [Rhizorhabdus dicambivorans]|uniref:AMP-dependent synthetase n=1 Tax=Rhizorhabdus dicambivorans TaxID=1850238 RepID=A0A2A4FXZ0_9SPHN|nr:AMP-binding protein [Rhizorhabdus dicambivorans]ATE64157.1 AMP-dependent synthetase [Rhizorhabdus dicambivorans]PCE42572.1 AMP-dependent synthetase [Rhizorhabdus dicambivorans]